MAFALICIKLSGQSAGLELAEIAAPDESARIMYLCDESVEVPTGWNHQVFRCPKGWGSGSYRKLACGLAVEMGAEVVASIDADNPHWRPAVERCILAGGVDKPDVLIGRTTELRRNAVVCGFDRLANRLAGRRLELGGDLLCFVFAVCFLTSVPFETNHEDDRFDTEIVLQAVHLGAKVEEFEISDDSMARARNRLLRSSFEEFVVALLFRMHRMGMLCALRYRNLTPMRYQDKTYMMYSSHALALRVVRSERARTVLDIGCGPGFIANQCRSEGITVTGIDAYPPLPGMMDEFHLVDLEIGEFPVDPFAYDCVLMLDVIEHIADPETFLIALRNRSEPRSIEKRAPLLVISTPNVAFFAVRLNLLLGRFSYAERGILDITHKRLFTRSSLLETLSDCGYALVKVIPVGAPFQTVVGGSLGKLLGAVADSLARVWPTMFAFQFIVTCRPRRGIRQLMRQDNAAAAMGNQC